ncbi:MAG: hypothetical protein ACRCV5_15810 [Afipia sp.]
MKVLLALVLCFSAVGGNYALAAKAIVNPVGTLRTVAVTLPAGTTTGAIDLGNDTLVGIRFPTTFTGTTVTFTASESLEGTYVGLYNASGAVSYTIAQARFYVLNPADFRGVRFLKVVSGSSEGADRTLYLTLKAGG